MVSRGCPETRFVDALCLEAVRRRSFFAPGEKPKTLYFGGGTPSLLAPEQFRTIVETLKRSYDLSALEEFTIEVNPDDIVSEDGAAKMWAWRESGVNRISMGIQSFRDEDLKWMNRRHSAESAEAAFRRLRKAGFDNISIDLIFGYPLLDEKGWEFNVSKALELHPDHISCYQLSIDPDSMLAAKAEEGKFQMTDDEICAQEYSYLQRRLREAGYLHYEVSNFSLPGRHSRHNSGYWSRDPYLGLGPAAHSFDGERSRSWNAADLQQWLSGEGGGGEQLTDEDVLNEKIMLGLRTSRGIEASLLSDEAKKNASLLVQEGGRYRIPEDKFFISDSIIGGLFV